MTEVLQRVAVKAIVTDAGNRVLVLRKSQDDERHAGNSGRYNLPGGKVNPGEHIGRALVREVKEEAGLEILEVGSPVFVGEWRPVVGGVEHQIIGIFFLCQSWRGDVQLSDEHDGYEWINKQELASFDVLPPEDQALAVYFGRPYFAKAT